MGAPADIGTAIAAASSPPGPRYRASIPRRERGVLVDGALSRDTKGRFTFRARHRAVQLRGESGACGYFCVETMRPVRPVRPERRDATLYGPIE